MISVQEAVLEIVLATPLLEYLIQKSLLNFSSFARETKPLLEEKLIKDVSEQSIIMALSRIKKELNKKEPLNIDLKFMIESVHIHIDLVEVVYEKNISKVPQEVLISALNFSKSPTELALIFTSSNYEKIKGKINANKIIKNLSAISFNLKEENITQPGVYYNILKFFAFFNINITEMYSSPNWLTIVINKNLLDNTLKILDKVVGVKS